VRKSERPEPVFAEIWRMDTPSGPEIDLSEPLLYELIVISLLLSRETI
jgi:hypothetical protein